MGFECRLFGEVLKEDLRNVQEALDHAAADPPERFRVQEIVYAASPNPTQFQKTVHLRKLLPIFSFEREIYQSFDDQGLAEWCLRIEGIPLRGLDWYGQFPCIVQDVTESRCLCPEPSLLDMCRLTFQLKESHQFLRFGSRYKIQRDGFQMEVTVSRLKAVVGRSSQASHRLLSDTHYLVEISVQAQQPELKAASQAMHELLSVLHPWVVATVT